MSMEADWHMFLINLVYEFFQFDIPRVSLDVYSVYPISNVNFNFSKTFYNDYKCVMPGITHEKLGLTYSQI